MSRETGRPYDVRDTTEVSIEKKARVVCQVCNNGWMSALEVRARPILAPMMLGKPTILTAEDQAVAALWAEKTAFVLEQTAPTNLRCMPQVHRDYVYEHRAAPAELAVRLAAYAGAAHGPIYRHTCHTIQPTNSPDVEENANNVYVACFGVGRLVFQLFGHRLGTDNPIELAPPADVVQIWPSSGSAVRWPPRRLLGSRQDLTAFSWRLMAYRNVTGPSGEPGVEFVSGLGQRSPPPRLTSSRSTSTR